MPSECVQALSPGIFIVNSPESIYSPKDIRPGSKQQLGPGVGLVMSNSHNSNDDQVGGRKNTLQENGRELTFGGLDVEGDVGSLLDEGRDVMLPATEVLLDGVNQLNSQLMQDMIAGETTSTPEDSSRVSSPGGIISPSSIHPESYFHGSDTGFHDNTTQMSLGEKYAGLKLEDSSCLTSIDSMWSTVADSGDDGDQVVCSRKLMKSTRESDTSTSLSMQNVGEDEEVFDAAGAAQSSQFVFTKFGSDVPGIFTFGVNQASISTSTSDAISRPLSSTTTVETKSPPVTPVSPSPTPTPLPAESEEVVSAPPVKRMKEPSLNVSFPAKAAGYELRVVIQPEEQHRARYMTEGSRGSIKDRSQQNHPVVKLLGYNGTEPVKLLVFIGTDTGKVKPHGFYQACRVCGKTSSNCDQQDIEGTTVIEYMLQTTEEMTACIDGVGILKLRNADVEQRIGIARSKKKSTRTRLVFRVNIPKPDGSFHTLQVASSPISCTQPAGQPEICKKSLSESSVEGGQELFIIGKNFTKGTKVIFQERKDKIVWTAEAPLDNDYFQQSHLICIVPEYKTKDVDESVNVEVVICCSGRSSDPSPFTYRGVRKEDTVVKVKDVPIPMETEPSPMKSAVAPEALEWNKMFEKVSKVGSSQQAGSPNPTASFVNALLQQEKERELKKEVDEIVTSDLGLSMDTMCRASVPQQTLHSIVKTDMGNMIEITNKLGSAVHNQIPVDICPISKAENPLAESLQTENIQIQNTPDIKSVLTESPSIQSTDTVNTSIAPTLQSPVVPEISPNSVNMHMADSANSQAQDCGSLDVSPERIVILTDRIEPSEPAVHEKKNTLDGQLNLNNLTLTSEQKGVLVDLLQSLVEQKRILSSTERKPDGQPQQKQLLRDQQNERQEQLLKDHHQQYLQIELRNESQMVDHGQQEKQQTIQFHLQDQQQQLKQEHQLIERQQLIQQQLKQEQEDIQQQLQQQQQQAAKQQLEEQQQQDLQHQQMMQHEQMLQIQQDDQQNQQRQQDLQLQQQQQQQQQEEFIKEQQLKQKQQQEMQQKQQELHRELQRQEHQEQQKQMLLQQQQQEQQHMKMQQQLQDQRNQQRLQEQLKQQQLKEFQQHLRKQHQLNEQQFHLQQQESSPCQEQQSVNTSQTEQIQQLTEHQQCPITTSNAAVAMQNPPQQGPQHILIIDTAPNQQHIDKDNSNQQCVNEQKTPLAIGSPIQQQQAHHVLIQGGQIPRVQAVVNQIDSANQRKPQLHVKCQTRNESNSALRTTMTNQVIRQPQPILPKPPVAAFLQPQVICSIIEQPSKSNTDQTIVSSSHQESSAVIGDIGMSKNGFGSSSSELATLLLHTSNSQVVTSDSQRPVMVTVTQPHLPVSQSHLQDVTKSPNVQTNMTSTAAVIHIPTSGFQLDPRSQANTQPTTILSQGVRVGQPADDGSMIQCCLKQQAPQARGEEVAMEVDQEDSSLSKEPSILQQLLTGPESPVNSVGTSPVVSQAPMSVGPPTNWNSPSSVRQTDSLPIIPPEDGL